MKIHVFNVIDFCNYPGGRYMKDGNGSAEQLREEYIIPLLEEHKGDTKVEIDFTLCAKPPSNDYLEEAFGGLIRHGYTREFLQNNLIITTRPISQDNVSYSWQYVDDAYLRGIAGHLNQYIDDIDLWITPKLCDVNDGIVQETLQRTIIGTIDGSFYIDDTGETWRNVYIKIA